MVTYDCLNSFIIIILGAFPPNASMGFPTNFAGPTGTVFPGGMTGGAGAFTGMNMTQGGQFPVFNNGMNPTGFAPSSATPANPFFGMSAGMPPAHQFPIQVRS